MNWRPLLLAGAGFAGCALGLLFAPREMLAAWLVCWLAWGAIPFGALALLMILILVPGSWRNLYQRPLTLAAGFVPLVAVAALPLLVGERLLYPWASTSLRGTLPTFKAEWLSNPFFSVREIVFLGVLSALAWGILNLSSPARVRLAAFGLIPFALLASLVGIDFAESIEPHFHSSIYGLLILSDQALAAISFAILLEMWRYSGPVPRAAAGLLVTTLLLWAYMHAMQYVVIWSGDIPEEVRWYAERGRGAWLEIGWAVFLLQAIVPFVALLAPAVRLNPRFMIALSALILLVQPVQAAWMVLPGLDDLGLGTLPLIAAASAAMLGTAWITAVLLASLSIRATGSRQSS